MPDTHADILEEMKILERADTHIEEDTAGVSEEGDVDLNIDETLEYVGVHESDNDINPDHFVFQMLSTIIILC